MNGPFTLEWSPEATDDLADIWVSAANRRAVTDAANSIERTLSTDPLGGGVFLSEGLLKFVMTPLVFFYSVDSNRKTVEIGNVRALPGA